MSIELVQYDDAIYDNQLNDDVNLCPSILHTSLVWSRRYFFLICIYFSCFLFNFLYNKYIFVFFQKLVYGSYGLL